MLFESSKMNQIAFQSESRHLIFDCFFRVWCRFSNRPPYLFQNLLNIMGEACDVFILGLSLKWAEEPERADCATRPADNRARDRF
jgi:hypothetical protein